MPDITAHSTREGPRLGRIRLVDRPEFALAELCCALAAGALWYVSDGTIGPWPLLIAAVPWAVRLASGRFPLPRTRLDWILWAFLLSAAISAWISFSPELALAKFWLIVGATVLYYALAGQRSTNIWPIVVGVGVFAIAVATYFLLTNDWQSQPVKISSLESLTLAWMHVRPTLLGGLHQLHPNVAGGIIAMLVPLAIAGGVRVVRGWHWAALLPVVVVGVILSAGLLLTSSRGAWFALNTGLLTWIIWIVASRLDQRLFLTRRQTLALAVVAILGIGLTIILLIPGGLLGLLDRLPGPARVGSRLSISRDAIDLMGDSPLLGAGLGSFDGLYSQYIRVIPNHFLIHGHNFYLNVGVEQGVVGMLLLFGLLGAAFWWLADPTASQPRRNLGNRSLLSGSLFATLVTLCIHGLVEDPLYGSRGALLLWLPLGLVASVFPRHIDPTKTTRAISRPAIMVGALALIAVSAFLLLSRSTLLSTMESSRGAIEMARIELASYPTDSWSDGREAPQLAVAEAHFEKALALDSENRTAWHRLGMIAMLRRDYPTAAGHLREAHRLDPQHKGILKSLAYSTIWSGDIDEGTRLLASIPEAQTELSTYAWWWGTQDKPELSQRADEALSVLSTRESTP